MQCSYHDDGTLPFPERDWVFVFGSNLAGRHGMGAAKVARAKFGAEYGVGRGPTGRAYAIPTKDAALRTLSLREIEPAIEDFLVYAARFSEVNFFVTRIGCGLAGLQDEMIAPLFARAPSNCSLPKDWRSFRMSQSAMEILT
jgi:hypothetical protein